MSDQQGHAKDHTGQAPVKRYVLTPQEIAARYPSRPSGDPRARWQANRARNRARGVNRFGHALPRNQGTNPRALGTNPRAREVRDA